MDFEIVQYEPRHRQQILQLSLRAWEPVFSGLKPAVPDYVYNAFYPDGWQRRQLADIDAFLAAEGDRVWVAKHHDAVLGWVGLRFHPEDRMGEIYVLAVDPSYQRQGIGTALIDFGAVQMKWRGLEISMVETGDDPGHANSRAAYERSGFERWPVARYFKKL